MPTGKVNTLLGLREWKEVLNGDPAFPQLDLGAGLFSGPILIILPSNKHCCYPACLRAGLLRQDFHLCDISFSLKIGFIEQMWLVRLSLETSFQ